MKINELLMNIRNKEFKLERGLEVKKYLPMEVKKTIAQAIIYDCTSDEDGVVKVDSVQRYMSYVKYMIKMHTNLEYTDDDYDTLCSTEYGETTLLNAIVSTFQNDANECNRILGLMMDDFIENNATENRIVYTISEFIHGLTRIAKSLETKMSDVNLAELLPSDLDLTSLANLINTTSK